MSKEKKNEPQTEEVPGWVKKAPELLPVWDWWVKEGRSTVTLLLAALARHLDETGEQLFGIDGAMIGSTYLLDGSKPKLALSDADALTLESVVLGAEMPPVDGSAYTDYDGSQNGILACIEYGVMSPVAAEEGQVLAAGAEILRGELAQTVVNFSALLQ